MIRLLTTICLWLIGASALAGPYESTLRVQCGNSFGTGTAVSKRHVITNSHVIDHRAGNRVTVYNTLGRFDGVVIAADPAVDLAIISTDSESLQPVEIGTDPKAGDRVTLYGFGRQGILRAGEGTVQPIKFQRSPGCPVVETDRGIEPGDSGGGMFDAAGRLVAVQWCSDGSNGNGAGRSGATPISLLGPLTQRWETQCGNGACLPWSNGRGIIIGRYNYSQPVQPRTPPAAPLVPVVPPKQQPPIVQQPVAPPACQCDPTSISARLDALDAKLTALSQATPSDGQALSVAQIQALIKSQTTIQLDYDRLAGEVAKRLPPTPAYFEIKPRKR